MVWVPLGLTEPFVELEIVILKVCFARVGDNAMLSTTINEQGFLVKSVDNEPEATSHLTKSYPAFNMAFIETYKQIYWSY